MNHLLGGFMLWGAILSAPEVVDSEILTLEGAIRIAEERAQDMVRAKEDLLLVDVENTRAVSQILPRLDLSASAREVWFGQSVYEARIPVTLVPSASTLFQEAAAVRTAIGPFVDSVVDAYSQPNFNLSVSARQLLYDGGRWWITLARVDDIRASRQAAIEVIRNNLRLEVVRAFYAYARAKRDVATFEKQVDLTEAQLKRTKTMVEAGSGKPNDVATAERNLVEDQVALARRKLTQSSGGRSLNLILGRDPGTKFDLVLPLSVSSATTSLEPLRLPPVVELVNLAFRSRPEVARAKSDLEVSAKNVDIRAADYWPVVSLGASYTRVSSRRPDRTLDPNLGENYSATLGLNLNWTLFSGFSTAASVEEGTIELRKAEVAYRDLLRQVERDVLDRRERLTVLFEVLSLARDGARAAEEAVRLADGLYKQGRGTALELRDAELRLTQARLSVAEARFDLEIGREELHRALGRDLPGVTEVSR